MSYGVPLSAATMDSVPGWLVPQAMEEMAVSMWSAPFSGLELAHAGDASGVVGMDEHRKVDLGLQRADQIASGERGQQAAMSLMAMESTPMAAICRACSTNSSTVCTGLVV